MRSAEELLLQLKSPIKAPKEAQKGKLERGLETNSQKGSFPDALQQPKLSSRAGGSSILTLAGDCILEPFWEAFWLKFRLKIDIEIDLNFDLDLNTYFATNDFKIVIFKIGPDKPDPRSDS